MTPHRIAAVGFGMVAVSGLLFLAACGIIIDERRGAAGSRQKAASTAMAAPMMLSPAPFIAAPERDRFPEFESHGWTATDTQPVSTFAAEVDTASYAFVRRLLREGRLPPKDAVRAEEMVNYFPYDYRGPDGAVPPFRPGASVVPSPWHAGAMLLHIGLKGWDVPRAERPRARLTFLVDVSGSMAPIDRLPLIRKALGQLVDGLRADDSVAIVAYAGQAGIVLPPTPGSERGAILTAIEALSAGGGTAGANGIRLAYRLAEQVFEPEAVNRVVLATDGDFNIGENDPEHLEELIATKRKTGIYLSVIGVGSGNFNDALMQRLAQSGNGQAAYLDSLLEARKIWGRELASSMVPIADDVKFQVEFNPDRVAEYRLVGYETRALSRADFANDAVDAGEIGGGHAVTAIYEFRPVGAPGIQNEPPLYGPAAAAPDGSGHVDEIALLRLRYKPPRGTVSAMIVRPVTDADVRETVDAVSDDVRFAVAVAGYAQLLRREGTVETDWDAVARLADGARGDDADGLRAEFVQLVRLAESLSR